MSADPRRTTSIKIHQDIWRKAKAYAAERGLTLSEVVENALLREIRSAQTEPEQER